MTRERKQFLHNVFTTAIEGNPPWAHVRKYHWATIEEGLVSDDLDGFSAMVQDTEAARTRPRKVDARVIERGIRRIGNAAIKSSDLGLHHTSRITIAGSSLLLDAGNIDAELADYIVQVGLFGTVLYS